MTASKPRAMRRVTTGENARGKSVILRDEASPHVLEVPGFPGLALTNLWVTDSAPADNAGAGDAAARPIVLEPPPGGTVFRVVDFPPDAARPAGSDRARAFQAMGAASAMDPDASRHPAMHRTATVDYALVLDARSGRSWTMARSCCGRATA